MSTHLDALELRLSHERERLARARSLSEQELRRVWVAQLEREVAAELQLLGAPGRTGPTLSDDDLLAALGQP